MKTRWLVFILCGAAATGLFYAGMADFDRVAQPPAEAGVTAPTKALPGGVTPSPGNKPPASLGPALTPAADRSRFQLVGVIAPGDPNSGSQRLALVAIGGKQAQVFRVGDVLDSDWVLQTIQAHNVLIGSRSGTTVFSLELAAPGSGAIQAGAPHPTPRGHPPSLANDSQHGSAPNVLLNNPADMAPADANGLGAPPSR